MGLPLLYQHLQYLVVVVGHLVLRLEVVPELDQALLDLLVVGTLEGIKYSSSHQQVGEGDDDEGECSDLNSN